MARHSTDASDTSDTCFTLFIFIFIPHLYYQHNIFIITNHHRIIFPKISYTIANVLSNLSDVSGVDDCIPELRSVFGTNWCTVKNMRPAPCPWRKPRTVCYAILFSGSNIRLRRPLLFCAESSVLPAYHSLFCSPVRPIRYNSKHYLLDSIVHL